MVTQVAPHATRTVAAALARVRAGLDAIDLTDYQAQSPAQARATARELRELQSRIATHVGAAVRAVQVSMPSKTAAQRLAKDFGNDTRAAHRDLRQSQLAGESSLAEQAAADGKISHAHTTVIGRALRDLPSTTTPQQRSFCERALIRDAARLSPRDLETRGRRITDQFKPEPNVDADEDALLRAREARARTKLSHSFWDNHDGTWSGKYTITELHGQIMKTLHDAYTAPRRDHLDPSADPYETQAHKQGKALCDMLEYIPTDKLPTSGGSPIRIMIGVSEDSLRSRVSAATLATGERLSAGELRRLAANHGIIPAVLGGDSVPVDLGRTQRLFSKAQRDALAVMDGGCTGPGCDRPPSWCEIQHCEPWALGGKTDLDNATLHCSACHHEADAQGWKYRRVKGVMHIDRGKGRGWEINHRYRP
jgi:hypothetical protein